MVRKLKTLIRLIIKIVLLFYLRSKIYIANSRLVGSGYGNWYLPSKVDKMSKGVCLVGGVGEDISFELELANQSCLTFELYDFTPRASIFFKKNIDAIVYDSLLPTHEGFTVNSAVKGIDVSRLSFHSLGIGVKSGSFSFKKPSDPKHVSFSVSSSESISASEVFEVVDFNILVGQIKPEARRIVKLDIEGSELALLCSDTHRQALCSFEIVLIELDFLKFARFTEIWSGISNLLKCLDTHSIYYADDYNVGFIRR